MTAHLAGSSWRRHWLLPTIVLGHLALSFACVRGLSNLFYLSGRVVLLHMSLVGGSIAAWTAAIAYGLHHRRLTSDRLTRFLLSAAATCASTLLALLYLGDLIGNYFWGDNLNFQVTWQYAGLVLPNRAPFFIAGWVYVAAFGAVALLFGVYWSCSSAVLSSIDQGARMLQEPFEVGRRTVLAVASILVLVYGVGISWLGWGLFNSGLLHYEPIVGFFMESDSLFDFGEFARDRDPTGNGHAIRANYPRGQSFTRKNVIFIIVDSLRADHMGVYGYERPTTPFLSRIFEEGRLKRVELALSTCAETNCGVLSTLKSKVLAPLASDAFSIDRLLRDQGYEIYRILSGNHDWQGLRGVYGDEQALYFDSTNSTHYAVNDDRVLFEGLDRVPNYHGTPAFLQFHLMAVHSAGIKHEEYRRYQPSDLRRNLDWLLKGDDRYVVTNSYDNGVLEADATIERLFDQLEKKGYLPNALCVILADHGEGLGERGLIPMAHQNWLYQEYIHIPLLIYDEPDVKYGNLSLARQIDVAPTIIDRLGLPQPSSWEGHSLLDSDIPRYSYHHTGGRWVSGSRRWHGCNAVVDHVDPATYKYVRCGAPPHEELFELATDPLEKHDLSAGNSSLLDDLRARLRDHLVHEPSPNSIGSTSP